VGGSDKIKENEIDRVCSTHENYKECMDIFLENLKGKDNLVDQGVDGCGTEMDLKKYGVRIWIGFKWLRIGSGNRML
jgi:hypothetical protein